MPSKRLHICSPNYLGLRQEANHMSMMNLAYLLGSRNQEFIVHDPNHTIASSARLACINSALNDPQCEKIMFIDDDMTFTPQHFIALEKAFDEMELDFLTGLAFANYMPTKPCIFGKWPQTEEWGEKSWWGIVSDYPKKQLFEVYATGLSFSMIRRSVFERIKGDNTAFHWFHYPHPECANEDIAFCLWCQKNGIKIHCDSRISIGHISKDRPIIDETMHEMQGCHLQSAGGMTRMEFIGSTTQLQEICA